MKYSTKLSDTVHVMVLIAINQEKSLSSASIAESVHTNPGFVRQLMLKLKKAGLMTSVAGHARPSLSKDRKSTRLNSSHLEQSRMPSSA